jgi:hypothetical protein
MSSIEYDTDIETDDEYVSNISIPKTILILIFILTEIILSGYVMYKYTIVINKNNHIVTLLSGISSMMNIGIIISYFIQSGLSMIISSVIQFILSLVSAIIIYRNNNLFNGVSINIPSESSAKKENTSDNKLSKPLVISNIMISCVSFLVKIIISFTIL